MSEDEMKETRCIWRWDKAWRDEKKKARRSGRAPDVDNLVWDGAGAAPIREGMRTFGPEPLPNPVLAEDVPEPDDDEDLEVEEANFAGGDAEEAEEEGEREEEGGAAQFATAAEAFGNTTRALKIQPMWLDQIVRRLKLIEIRSTANPHPGEVSLARTVSKQIVARAKLGPGHLMTEEEKAQHPEAIEALSHYDEHWAWEIEEVLVLDDAIDIPPKVGNHSVQWVTRERWEKFDAGEL